MHLHIYVFYANAKIAAVSSPRSVLSRARDFVSRESNEFADGLDGLDGLGAPVKM